ncbi:MAG: MJ1255/VC2487 family glycosyltransferase [Candidatus Pacearchaeota archaeon]
MNILYGVSGVGFGHASRALLIANYLRKKGHKIKILTYGDGYEKLKNDFDCIKIDGLEIVFEGGKIKKIKTLKQNIKIISKNIMKRKNFSGLIKSFHPDLCISDMEAIVSILSKWYKIPLVSIDNQHAITNLKIKFPIRFFKDYVISKQVIKSIVKKADVFIISSFAKLPLKKKNTIIISPIVREEIIKLKPKYGNKILVYISRGDENFLSELKNIKEKFVVYGFNIKKKDGNLEFKTRENFEKDLGNCKFIIATSGFSLISEALYLKKPYLAIPIRGHFEQMFNALLLRKSGFGDFVEELSGKAVINFMGNLDFYRKNLKKYNINQKKLLEIVDKTVERVGKK